jgi:DnaJ-class molecular chaperone
MDISDFEPHMYECDSCMGTGKIQDTDERCRHVYRMCLDCLGTGEDTKKIDALRTALAEKGGE